MMVAEFLARQSGSPINGETPYPHHQYPHPHPQQQGDMSDYEQMQRKELFSQRKQREFIPDNKKDESYWDRRRRNNEAAKRSREKRRFNDMILEQRVVELSKENHLLKAQLAAIKDKFGINGETVVSVEQVMATLPTNEQVLSLAKRAKLCYAGQDGSNSPPLHSLPPPQQQQQQPQQPQSQSQLSTTAVPTAVIHRPLASSPPLDCEPYPYPFQPVLPPLLPPPLECGPPSVLNLSRSRSPFDDALPAALLHPQSHNSLPHKLRHKTHLGDKEVATALLSLQTRIKTEVVTTSAECGGVGEGGSHSGGSPPWGGDGEGSSDERDSGISLGAELADDSHLKSEVARLASEVANLKSILTRKP